MNKYSNVYNLQCVSISFFSSFCEFFFKKGRHIGTHVIHRTIIFKYK